MREDSVGGKGPKREAQKKDYQSAREQRDGDCRDEGYINSP